MEHPDKIANNQIIKLVKSYCALRSCSLHLSQYIYSGFYVAFNTVQIISQWVVGRVEEISTYSSLGFCTVKCRPTASNYQLSHLRPCGDRTPALEVGGESVTTLPLWPPPHFQSSHTVNFIT